jgi:hypothetical protein
MERQAGPDIRMMAIAPRPGAVDRAYIVDSPLLRGVGPE